MRRAIQQWAYDEDNLFDPSNRLFQQEQVHRSCAMKPRSTLNHEWYATIATIERCSAEAAEGFHMGYAVF